MCKELRMASLLNHIVEITAHRDHRDRSAARTRDIPRIIGAAIQWVIALQIHQHLRFRRRLNQSGSGPLRQQNDRGQH
jgi:hypothetical protein